MKLKEFLEKFICRNTLVRLWYKDGSGHIMITNDEERHKLENAVCMEWELLDSKAWQRIYLDNEVIGVTDIVVHDSFYKEAVNIVIKKKGEV